jgi:hypothetical protein
MECELEDCCFCDNHNICIATKEEFEDEEAALVANGYSGLSEDCLIYQGMIKPPWECPLCGDMGKVFKRPTRLMGATYPFDDPWKGDEHYEPCPLCGNNGSKANIPERMSE